MSTSNSRHIRETKRELEAHEGVSGERGAPVLQRLAPAGQHHACQHDGAVGYVEHGGGVRVGDVRHEGHKKVKVTGYAAARPGG